MKFSDYSKTEDKTSKKRDEPSALNKRKLFEMMRGFEGKSEDEIISAIMETAKKNRAEGKLSDEEIDGFVKTIYPMLDENKRKKLDEITAMIKAQK